MSRSILVVCTINVFLSMVTEHAVRAQIGPKKWHDCHTFCERKTRQALASVQS
jgi:hypothetical protein